MIRRLRGELTSLDGESVELNVGGLGYEVLVAPPTLERLAEREVGSTVELHTHYFMTIEGARVTPVLMGFETIAQRDFFERLLDVPRFGPRGALRSLTIPVATYARAIELSDTRLLKSLPGVGPQKAKDIVATLQGKLGPFVDAEEIEASHPLEGQLGSDAEQEAALVLASLGMSQAEVVQAILRVRQQDSGLQTADEIVKAIFRRR